MKQERKQAYWVHEATALLAIDGTVSMLRRKKSERQAIIKKFQKALYSWTG